MKIPIKSKELIFIIRTITVFRRWKRLRSKPVVKKKLTTPENVEKIMDKFYRVENLYHSILVCLFFWKIYIVHWCCVSVWRIYFRSGCIYKKENVYRLGKINKPVTYTRAREATTAAINTYQSGIDMSS